MKVHYDSNTMVWYQSILEDPVTMGGDKKMVSYDLKESDNISFELCLNNNHIGPLIGIMTARKKDGSMAGNGSLFKEIQKKLISFAGISFIFTLDGAADDYIDGYTFIHEKNSWIKVRVPYPDLVYNRIPFRKSEQDIRYQSFFSTLKKKNIPFFNPCFIDKYELYCLLVNHPILHSFLPKTILIHDKRAFSHFLKGNKSIYLKPAQSARGKGIYRVNLDIHSQIKLEGLIENKTYQSLNHFWEEWEMVFQEKNYLAQEEIKSFRYQGKRFDFRILAHAENDSYFVTGVGIRQSQGQEITTHIPSGGRLLPYQLVQTEQHDQFIETVVTHIGEALSDEFGYFGEFSIDAGISNSGHYYLYEVNSKPMSFDEMEIEEKKIKKLCLLFLQLTNFQK
jgi:glutathione synthase/RimK-type ligase-like ATP-grasp enzyme